MELCSSEHLHIHRWWLMHDAGMVYFSFLAELSPDPYRIVHRGGDIPRNISLFIPYKIVPAMLVSFTYVNAGRIVVVPSQVESVNTPHTTMNQRVAQRLSFPVIPSLDEKRKAGDGSHLRAK